jgi:hypothetical protein
MPAKETPVHLQVSVLVRAYNQDYPTHCSPHCRWFSGPSTHTCLLFSARLSHDIIVMDTDVMYWRCEECKEEATDAG